MQTLYHAVRSFAVAYKRNINTSITNQRRPRPRRLHCCGHFQDILALGWKIVGRDSETLRVRDIARVPKRSRDITGVWKIPNAKAPTHTYVMYGTLLEPYCLLTCVSVFVVQRRRRWRTIALQSYYATGRTRRWGKWVLCKVFAFAISCRITCACMFVCVCMCLCNNVIKEWTRTLPSPSSPHRHCSRHRRRRRSVVLPSSPYKYDMCQTVAAKGMFG